MTSSILLGHPFLTCPFHKLMINSEQPTDRKSYFLFTRIIKKYLDFLLNWGIMIQTDFPFIFFNVIYWIIFTSQEISYRGVRIYMPHYIPKSIKDPIIIKCLSRNMLIWKWIPKYIGILMEAICRIFYQKVYFKRRYNSYIKYLVFT